jgi:type I restriction enzyme S subunit
MASEWREMTLGDVITLQRGHDLPIQDRKPGIVPVVTSSGVSGTHNEVKAKAPGVVMGRYGTLGEIYFMVDDYWPHNTTLYVKDFKGNDPKFVYYLLKTLDFTAHNDKTSVPGLNRNHLHTIRVNIPLDIYEQRAIASILGSLDDKIELNRRMNATLEESARALFKSWFVDFDPVRAKMEGRQPKGLDAETAALFPDRLIESALGLIPEGWAWKSLSELVKTNAWTLGKNDLLERIEYIKISEVMRGEVGEIKQFERGAEPSRARRRLRHGDTVISTVRPDRGAYFLAYNPSPNLIASTGFAVFTPNSDIWGFVYAALTRPENFNRYGFLADGAAYPAIAPEIMVQDSITLPDHNHLIKLYHSIASTMYATAETNRCQSRTLAETRDSLLPRLLSGEVRI